MHIAKTNSKSLRFFRTVSLYAPDTQFSRGIKYQIDKIDKL
ncbi:hypothetical protein M2135_001056 [Parabacteroides sp. PF5-9]|nr:hypothetical protein [Parabacteroides sp. PF5-9]